MGARDTFKWWIYVTTYTSRNAMEIFAIIYVCMGSLSRSIDCPEVSRDRVWLGQLLLLIAQVSAWHSQSECTVRMHRFHRSNAINWISHNQITGIDRSIDCLMEFIHRTRIVRLIDWLIERVTPIHPYIRSIDCLIDFIYQRWIAWSIDWLIDSMRAWLVTKACSKIQHEFFFIMFFNSEFFNHCR